MKNKKEEKGFPFAWPPEWRHMIQNPALSPARLMSSRIGFFQAPQATADLASTGLSFADPCLANRAGGNYPAPSCQTLLFKEFVRSQ